MGWMEEYQNGNNNNNSNMSLQLLSYCIANLGSSLSPGLCSCDHPPLVSSCGAYLIPLDISYNFALIPLYCITYIIDCPFHYLSSYFIDRERRSLCRL